MCSRRKMGNGGQLLCAAILAVIQGTGQEGSLPATYPGHVVNGSEQQACPSTVQQQRVLSQIDEEVRSVVRGGIISGLCTGLRQNFPAASCSEIYRLNPQCSSGYYWIRNGGGAAVHLYCDMSSQCSGVVGWTRIAYLNMSDHLHSCPGAWQQITSPRRTCGRSNQAGLLGSGCSPVTYTSYGLNHRYVHGRVIGYQYGTPNAFDYFYNHQADATIEGIYLDGVSITSRSGSGPREHVWSFAGAYSESYTGPYSWVCSCTNTAASSLNIPIPSWVGTDYFCESGTTTLPGDPGPKVFYASDPLWDGQGCGASSCCSFRNPPWFCKQLRAATTADIDIRICADYYLANEDTPIELVEIYIQ